MPDLLTNLFQTGQITHYLTHDKPFGPEDSSVVTDPFCRNQLFQQQNRIYRELKQNPTLIIGRKGAGKTAFLQKVKYDLAHSKDGFPVEVHNYVTFANIVEIITTMTVKSISVEAIAQLWDITMWLALASHCYAVRERACPPKVLGYIELYFEGLGLKDKKGTAERVAGILTHFLHNMKDCPPDSLPNQIENSAISGVSHSVIKDLLEIWIREHHLRPIIIVDSLESYDLNQDHVQRAISGLLHCLGRYGASADYQARFCLPSELYNEFLSMSGNPAKDFTNYVSLRWDASELITLAAHRLTLYLKYHAETSEIYNAQLSHLDPSRRNDALLILEKVLPQQTEIVPGLFEPSLSSIMRHTQLLPRHLVFYLNQIWSLNTKAGGKPMRIEQKAIKDALRNSVDVICTEVFAAFRHCYPNAEAVCDACLPELPIVFDHSRLHQIYNQHGKKAVQTVHADDIGDFKKMLITLGVIGRVIGETGKYTCGVFEYAAPNRLFVSTHDTMCLHPAFSMRYNSIIETGMKPVYPQGSEIADIV